MGTDGRESDFISGEMSSDPSTLMAAYGAVTLRRATFKRSDCFSSVASFAPPLPTSMISPVEVIVDRGSDGAMSMA